MIENPYLEEYVKDIPPDEESARIRKNERFAMCGRYSWSVPTQQAIDLLVRLSPLVEIGAGTGYWAWMIRAAGGNIIAYDANPPGQSGENTWHTEAPTCYTHVERGSIEVLPRHNHRTLLLCWPPYSNQSRPDTLADKKAHLRKCMGYQALRQWRGERVVYVGEWRCCTAGWAFHDLLEHRYREIACVPLPAWPGIVDKLSVHERVRSVWSLPTDAFTSVPAIAPSPEASAQRAIAPLGPSTTYE